MLRIFWTGTKFNLTQIEVDKKVSIMFCALQTSNPPPCLYKRKYYLSWKTVCSTVYRFCSKSWWRIKDEHFWNIFVTQKVSRYFRRLIFYFKRKQNILIKFSTNNKGLIIEQFKYWKVYASSILLLYFSSATMLFFMELLGRLHENAVPCLATKFRY